LRSDLRMIQDMPRHFKPYNIDQLLLLPPNLREWLPNDHLSLYLAELLNAMDLSAIWESYQRKDSRGRDGYHPLMMVRLIVYGYSIGVTSSRKIEKATYEDVAFRVLSADLHPDHDTIANFRSEHLYALAGLFAQVLKLCSRAGLVKLGHVSIDGTKIAANASKHKSMTYSRMVDEEERLRVIAEQLLTDAARVDAEEDARYGKGVRGDELPPDLRDPTTRRQKIREAVAALEQEAREAAAAKAEQAQMDEQQRTQNGKKSGKNSPAQPPVEEKSEEAKPDPKAQRNFTDPDSRIMPNSVHKGSFLQGYNAQIAVDDTAQIIVATVVTQCANDVRQLIPVAEEMLDNVGKLPDVITADAGYFSQENVEDVLFRNTLLLVPPVRIKHRADMTESLKKSTATRNRSAAAAAMREKLAMEENRALYKRRKAIVEPVFGQIKEVRGFRRFALRGFQKVTAEFDLIALTHNLLKLFRHQKSLRNTLCPA